MGPSRHRRSGQVKIASQGSGAAKMLKHSPKYGVTLLHIEIILTLKKNVKGALTSFDISVFCDGQNDTKRGKAMKMSETIGELATALAKAQGQIEAATKGSINPAFKSKYADINALRDVIREPLATNDLSILQFPRTSDNRVEVETMILHKSGEFMSEILSMPVGKPDAHGIGSALTYARRYGMSAILNLAADDDDGNAAVAGQAKAQEKPVEATRVTYASALEAAKKGKDAFNKWWRENKDVRSTISETQMVALKKSAEDAELATFGSEDPVGNI